MLSTNIPTDFLTQEEWGRGGGRKGGREKEGEKRREWKGEREEEARRKESCNEQSQSL